MLVHTSPIEAELGWTICKSQTELKPQFFHLIFLDHWLLPMLCYLMTLPDRRDKQVETQTVPWGFDLDCLSCLYSMTKTIWPRPLSLSWRNILYLQFWKKNAVMWQKVWTEGKMMSRNNLHNLPWIGQQLRKELSTLSESLHRRNRKHSWTPYSKNKIYCGFSIPMFRD